MNILEREIEDIIFAALKGTTRSRPIDHGLNIGAPFIDDSDPFVYRDVARQVSLGRVGICDIVAITAYYDGPDCVSLNLEIVELKRGKIGYAELGQVCRYVHAARQVLMFEGLDRGRAGGRSFGVNVRGVLIGAEIERGGDFRYLAETLCRHSDVSIYTYRLDFDSGISFEGENMTCWRHEDTAGAPLLGRLLAARKACIEELEKPSRVLHDEGDHGGLSVDEDGNLARERSPECSDEGS